MLHSRRVLVVRKLMLSKKMFLLKLAMRKAVILVLLPSLATSFMFQPGTHTRSSRNTFQQKKGHRNERVDSHWRLYGAKVSIKNWILKLSKMMRKSHKIHKNTYYVYRTYRGLWTVMKIKTRIAFSLLQFSLDWPCALIASRSKNNVFRSTKEVYQRAIQSGLRLHFWAASSVPQ